ncbi:MAG: hypothetical protein KDB39_05580, partial [Austwickia sp.]|nr:hypothetical protein [Austwickia sp.]
MQHTHGGVRILLRGQGIRAKAVKQSGNAVVVEEAALHRPAQVAEVRQRQEAQPLGTRRGR